MLKEIIITDPDKKYDETEFPKILRDAFYEILDDIKNFAYKQNKNVVITEEDQTIDQYISKCAEIIQNPEAKIFYMIHGSIHGEPNNVLTQALIKRLKEDEEFKGNIYVGVLYRGDENLILLEINKHLDEFIGNLSVDVLGQKPLIHGVATDKEAIIQHLHTSYDGIRKNYIFENINIIPALAKNIAEYLNR